MKLFKSSNLYRSSRFWIQALFSITIASFIVACDGDDVGDSYYTFTGETVGVYLDNRPETYSEFTNLLIEADVKGLLNAYGKYTCFAPTNEAMYRFYETKGYTNGLADIPKDSIQLIAFDHIIKNFVVESDEFNNGFIPRLTMSGRYLKIAVDAGETGLIFMVNDSSTITLVDEEVHNGVLHQVDNVLSPTQNSLVESIAINPKFSIFYEALMQTELYTKLLDVEDYDYDPGAMYDEQEGIVQGHGIIQHVPKTLKYGFTALLESDATFQANGVSNLEDLKTLAASIYDKMYPQDAQIDDITDRKNSLNRFIAYHLINKKLPSKFFIEKYDNTGSTYDTDKKTHSVKIYDMFEYIEPMCPNTLMEVRTDRSTNSYNIFNRTDNGEVHLTDDFDNDAINGVYHEIDGILAYSSDVFIMLTTKKIRMDAASFFPELTNNNMRVGHATKDYPSEQWCFPEGYIERVDVSPTTQFNYINADDRFCDYQGDEVFLTGLYDFEIITPPIPAGTYEVRFGYQPTAFRGAAQLYWDGIPCGIPLDLRVTATDPAIGYVQPGTQATDPNGYENDKMMRNRGYMKGPGIYKAIDEVWYPGSSARMSQFVLRRILGIYDFPEDGHHVFKVKAARSGQFMFDYLEFVPIGVIESEGID